ncbi:MAG: ATP-dependent RecD-like DNA helicase [Ruminococcaceae bacterium]|nr:ATP-dependent RecD-like DNA helicase [Oscillospiraceae bacterium]
MEVAEIFGIAEQIVYRREDTQFTVLDISTEDGELITVVGALPDISVGEEIRFIGYWDTHQNFGRQFRAEVCERKMPTTAATMLKYLSSGAIKGIGPATATKIIETFGERAFEVIENHPKELAKIKGISKAKAEKMSKDFSEKSAVREIIIQLGTMGLSPNECLATFKVFGSNSVNRIKENPYLLCIPEIGIDFERVDAMVSTLENKPKDEYRIKAGILHVVNHNLGNGHTCLPREKLLSPCANLLDIAKDTVDITMDDLVAEKELKTCKIDGEEFVFLPYIFDAEYMIAQRIKMMLKFPVAGRETLLKEIEKLEKDNNIKYEKLQREAIMTAVEKGLLILTGGPGTGKTTTINGILELFERDGLDVVLCAPTGRAAQRMSEITGRDAMTIHRLLKAERTPNEFMHFAHDEQNPIEAEVLIVDELSMVDVVLFSALLSALPIGCRLIMIGDTDQLPPVGPGNVLGDLIDSELLPVVRLTEVFRQAMQSLIVSNAHNIVRGELPELARVDNDFFHMERDSAKQVVFDVIELYKERLPNAYEYDSVKDIQVLCPSKKGDAGIVNLNRVLQKAVNPPAKGKSEIKFPTKTFREGDKVMQVKNNYNIQWIKGDEEGEGVFNGDTGTLIKIDRQAGIIKVDFDGRIASYPTETFSELELAYAVTVHKSQGSEFEAVILPVIDVPPQLAYRNLLYTAVTRARSKMITIGSKNIITAMVENDKKIKRYSALKHFLK